MFRGLDHPSVASRDDHCSLPVDHLPCKTERDICDVTSWSRCHESITTPPPAPSPYSLCQWNQHNEILGEVTRSLASSPVQSASSVRGQSYVVVVQAYVLTHTHTAPYVWLCNRVIIVLVKWVIDRWRCCSEWQLHPQSEIKTMVSPPHGEEHADATLYYNVAATMSKPLPGLTDPIPLRVLMK